MNPASTSFSAAPLFCYPNPNQHRRLRPNRNLVHSSSNKPLRRLSSLCTEQNERNRSPDARHSTNAHHHTFLEDLYSFTHSISHSDHHGEPEDTMRWSDWKAALGQRFNFEGIVSSVAVVTRDRKLVIPHVSVPDIRHIDWLELHRRGFKGVVFDKDNTITAPYSLTLWPPLGASMDCCKSVFGNDIAVFSNSAGLSEYDPDGLKARALEKAIGIRVLRHRMKKPAGTSEEIEKHFGCTSSQLIMVGDRPFTDIVYGNRNGFLTILTEPLSLSQEPFIVKQVRKLEVSLVSWWSSQGLKPSSHILLPDPLQCVKDPSSL
uniref:Uncharacterized protein n=1 Tax=Kalanchoe fedtschenkoi TaxID=63787 RepID=A0A7N0ZRF1_KALFE